jgi:uncharacterized membrane protein YdfJ with MMPL/SSD domain
MLDRIASLASRRPGRVVAVAALLTALAFALGGSAIDRLYPYSAADPDSESSRATDRFLDLAGFDPDAGLVALVEPRAPVRTEAARRQVERIADRIFLDPSIAFVQTYWSTGDPAWVSVDGRETFIVGNFAVGSDREQQLGAERIRDHLADEPGVRFGGEAPGNLDARDVAREDLARAQLIAFPLLLIGLLWFFRGVVAALLPLMIAGEAIAGCLAGLRLINELVPVSVFALNLALGLSLALGVDYSLLVVSRYREEMARDGPGVAALRRTLATAGRTVLFSSLVVGGAMLALFVFPQRFLYSMGIAGLLVALVAGAAALVLLPAVLLLLGEGDAALAPARLRRASEKQARPAQGGGWYRLSRAVMRRPLPIALACGALLLTLALPFLGARFIPVDVRALPDDTESRQVRETLNHRFPPNPSLPLLVLVESAPDRRVKDFADRIRSLPGARDVDPPGAFGPGNSLIVVVPGDDPASAQSTRLVRDIRSLPAPAGVLVGGRAAEVVDQRDSIHEHVPPAVALLCLTTVVAIFLLTGSVVLPVKAVLMSLLSLTAAFGALVLVFQDGRLEGLLSYQSPGALDLAQPLVLLAVGFGVSTDYGVILLSRIKEGHDAGLADEEAIALGLERSGRIVTAAALLLCIAVGAFATSQIVFLKELGVGVALAVLIDATIVRALLVPSLMKLLGRWNWWAPAPLRRLHLRLTR